MAANTATFGIDVSRWQGNFNFAQAKKEGVQFVIIKAGGGDDGLYKDSKYETFYKQCKELGLPVGAYFFGAATSVDTAIKEADKFISLLNGKQFEMPVYYDVEGKMLNLDKNLLTNIILAFCKRVEDAGYYTGMYGNPYSFNSKIDDNKLKHFCHWVAYWAKSKPKLNSGMSVGIWQFGGETNFIRSNKVAGVVCDQNYCYVDYTSAIKKYGLNGFPGGDVPTKSYVIVTASSLNCREKPDINSKIIGAFYKDTRLELLEECGEWYKVKGVNGDHDVIGYCYAQYLRKE